MYVQLKSAFGDSIDCGEDEEYDVYAELCVPLGQAQKYQLCPAGEVMDWDTVTCGPPKPMPTPTPRPPPPPPPPPAPSFYDRYKTPIWMGGAAVAVLGAIYVSRKGAR